MELPEAIVVINNRLLSYFGKFETGEQNYRVVWSDDQFEKRILTHTREGFILPNPIVGEIPKYRQWIQERFILERLLPVIGDTDLITKTTYEPVWTFEDKFGNALPPKWEAIEVIINSVHKAAARATGAKYKEPEALGNTQEAIDARVDKLEAELFGNESKISDALAHDSAVGFGARKRDDTKLAQHNLSKEL